MQKYRVLKPYPKQITNSGRLITLRKGKSLYLKKEAQVLRLVSMGFLKPIVEMPKKQAKPAKKPMKKEMPKYEEPKAEKEESSEDKEESKKSKSRRKSKSEYLNKKK